MSRLRIVLIGEGAEDHIDQAEALYQRVQGRKSTYHLDGALFLVRPGEVKVIVFPSRYALVLQEPGLTPSQFRLEFDDAVPLNVPSGDLLPTTPTFFPVSSEYLLTLISSGTALTGISLTIPGESASFQDVSFAAAIIWTVPYIVVPGLLLEPAARGLANDRLFMTYMLTGVVNPNDQQIQAKVTAYSSGVVDEQDGPGLPVLRIVSSLSISTLQQYGYFFRRIAVSPDVEKIIMYAHDGTYAGSLYDVPDVVGGEYPAVDSSPLLSAPSGSRLNPPPTTKGSGTANAGSRYVDHTLDIFTSENAAHYYMVKTTIDSAVDHHMGYSDLYDPNGSDTYLFPGCSLSVEKRLKSDFSLVATFNLTPSSIDTTFQGFPSDQVNANGCVNADGTFSGDNLPHLTRMFYQRGYVLVANDGTEFPIVTGVSISQADYNSGDANSFCQSVLLWLGSHSGDFYTWPGVDAVGLKISSLSGLGVNIGFTRYIETGIGDSNHALISLFPFESNNVWSIENITETGIVARLSGCGARTAVDDRGGVVAGDRFFVGSTYYEVAVDAESMYTVADGIIAALGSAAGPYTDHGGYVTIPITISQPVDLFYTSPIGYSLQREVVSISLVGGVPVVAISNIIPTYRAFFTYDI